MIYTGTDNDDKFIGYTDDDFLYGMGGNDALFGQTGSDLLDGGTGNDVLGGYFQTYVDVDGSFELLEFDDYDADPDTLLGGAGDDMIYAGIGDSVDGGADVDTLGFDLRYASAGVTGNLGVLTDGGRIRFGGAILQNIEQIGDVILTNFDDRIVAGAGGLGAFVYLAGEGGNDVLVGTRGRDVFSGGSGDDRLTGLGGNDILVGDQGNDVLIGGAGRDVLRGGAGADRFVFAAGDTGATIMLADRIEGFRHSDGDRIALNLIDADTTTVADDAFTFIGSAAFGGVAGQLRFERIGADTFVQGDTDGDSVADVMIRLEGDVVLVRSDFAL